MQFFHASLRHTLFFSPFADKKQEKDAALADISANIRDTTARDKPLLPWIKLATFGDVATDKGSLRHDGNVLEITGIEADYDGGVMELDAARERLEMQQLAAILYTSPSHTVARPRWRVLCPVSRPMKPERRGHLMGRLNGLFGGIFARESWTLSQAYYYGSVQRNQAHRVELVGGQSIDLHDDLDKVWIGKAATSAPSGTGPADGDSGDPRDDAELILRLISGEGFHVELCAFPGRYLARGMTRDAATDVLRGLMLVHPEVARDQRWRDRYASIPSLTASAEAKYRDDTAGGRREVARLIARMVREHRRPEEIRAAAFNEAERQNLPRKVAEDIAAWLVRRERVRSGGEHARRF